MSDEKQSNSELEADYQAMKSREDRIKAILAEKGTGPEVEKPVKKWWELITPENPRLVRYSDHNDDNKVVLVRKLTKIEESRGGYKIDNSPSTWDYIALVTGHEYRAYTLDPKDWPNLDDTEAPDDSQ